MKLSKNILLALIVAQALCQDGGSGTTVQGGSCKGGCVSCKTNGEIEWCLACYQKKHVMTNAIDGKCEGDPIANCEVQFVSGSTQMCAQCADGYALEIEITDKTDTAFKYAKATSCKAIADANAVDGEFKKDATLGEGERDQYFFASLCKYGYAPQYVTETVSGSSKTRGKLCQPTKSDQFYDENCYGYTSSGCDKCKNNMVKTTFGICETVPNNNGGISTDLTMPWFGKWSDTCNTYMGGFYLNGDLMPSDFSDSSNNNNGLPSTGDSTDYSSRGSGYYYGTSTLTDADACVNCYGVCTSDDFGSVGDGASFSKIITSLIISCLIFLFK